MEIIIEEISRGHKLLGRHKYAKQSVAIGRGYNNDLIISDPHVCPTHLTITQEGDHWLLTDNNSVNGAYIEQSKQAVEKHIVQSGDIVCFGKSQVRLIFPNHPVASSVPFSPFESLINLARQPAFLALSIVLFALLAGWMTYLSKPTEINFTQLLVPAIGMTLLVCVWPSLVALISHLTKHDARIFHQIGISFLFFNLMWLSDVFEAFVHFNTSSNLPISWLVAIIPIGLGFTMFWLNCYVGFHMSKTRRLVAAACLTSLLFGGGLMIKISKQPEFNPRPIYNSTIMTPSFLWTSSSSVDEFIEDSSTLFTKTQAMAKKDDE